jgi:hypothetical protein
MMNNSNIKHQQPDNFELEIEELILHGIAAGDRHYVGEAISQELTRLFAEQGIPLTTIESGSIARLDVGEVQVTPGLKPAAIGIQVAQTIYGGLIQ